MLRIITDKQLERFRDLLPLYRKIQGYSAEKLGSFLGLDRQQINRLENGKTKLTQVHFRAISQIMTEALSVNEIQDENDINIAVFVILVLVNASDDELDDEEYNRWKEILLRFSKMEDIGDPEEQARLLKGFAIAYHDSNDAAEDNIEFTLDILDEILVMFKDFVKKMNQYISEEKIQGGNVSGDEK